MYCIDNIKTMRVDTMIEKNYKLESSINTEVSASDESSHEYGSICEICKKRASCTFIKNALYPIFMCEEFEIDENIDIREITDQKKRRIEYLPEFEITNTTQEPSGLCANCSKVDDCTYDKPPGGVWHCDEYC